MSFVAYHTLACSSAITATVECLVTHFIECMPAKKKLKSVTKIWMSTASHFTGSQCTVA